MKRFFLLLQALVRWYRKRPRAWKIIISAIILLIVTAMIRNALVPADSEYELAYPTRDSIVETVIETGNVVSANAVPVYALTNGVVEEIVVENNAYVQKGETLFTVQSTASEQEKSAAWSNYLLAQTALESAKATEYSLQAALFSTWDTYRDKYDDDDYKDTDDPNRNEPDFQVPQKQWLSAEAAYKNQKSVVSQKQADLTAKWQVYQTTQDSTVIAPVSGIVQNVSVAKGQTVIAHAASSALRPILMLRQETDTVVEIEINETDIDKIHVGQKALFTVDGLDRKEFEGTVDRVDAIGTNTQGVIAYNAYITALESSDLIRPAMTATVAIETGRVENVLTVASSAVKPYQGGRAVRIVGENGEIEYLPVVVGLRGDKRTEIISGIDESTRIITALKNEQIKRNGGFFGG